MNTTPFPNFPHLDLQNVENDSCRGCLNFVGGSTTSSVSGIRCDKVPCMPTDNPQTLSRILVLREPAQVQFIPARRKADPATSKAAAVRTTPKAPPLRDRIVAKLEAGGPATGTELAAALDAKLNSVTPRFAELSSKAGSPWHIKVPRIRDSGIRRDGQIVWAAI